MGERSGELESMLERVADTYEREVERSLDQMTTLLEPLMTLGDGGDYPVHDAGGAAADIPIEPADEMTITEAAQQWTECRGGAGSRAASP